MPSISFAAVDSTVPCDGGSTLNPLTWMMCPVINGVVSAESSIESFVFALLKTPIIPFSGNCNQQNTTGCTFQVWSNFRIYGNVVLIIALLITIIVEIAGGGVVANYTIKKMLPRIIVAVILINLSIYIVAVLEDVFNILGSGLYDLIKTPFGDAWKLDIGGTTSSLFTVAATTTTAVAGGAVVVAGLYGLLTASLFASVGLYLVLAVVVPVLIAILGVLITLMIRQGLLVLLVMTSPIAFALYCLPNTESLFRRWWNLLLRTLVVYPVIVLLICMSQVMGIIFSHLGATSTLGGTKLMAIVAVAAPLFLIPFGFRMAGGVIGNVANGVRTMGNRLATGIQGNRNDPNSRINRARANMVNERENSNLTFGSYSRRARAYRAARRTGSSRQEAAGAASVAVAERKAAMTSAHAADQIANNPINAANRGNANYNEAGMVLAAMASRQITREQGEAELAGIAARDGGRGASAVAAARQIRQTAGMGEVFRTQNVEAAYGYGQVYDTDRNETTSGLSALAAAQTGSRTVVDPVTGRQALDPTGPNFAAAQAELNRLNAQATDGAIVHDKLVREAARASGCGTTVDAASGRLQLDEGDPNFGNASQKLIVAKGSLGAKGFGHLNNTGIDYDPAAGIARQNTEEYSHNRGPAFTAQAQSAIDSMNNPDYTAIQSNAIIARTAEELRLLVISSQSTPEQRQAANAGYQAILNSPAGAILRSIGGSAVPGGAGPPSPEFTEAIAQARRPITDVRVDGGLPPAPPTPPPTPPPAPPPAPPAPPTPPTYPRWSDDIIDIDSSGRPITPSGKFMSYENADVAEANADLIRDNLPPTNNDGNGQNNP